MPEKEHSPEDELNKAAIASSRNFDELIQVIEMLGGIQGSRQFYSAQELKDKINLVRNGKEAPDALTRSLGLRQKVFELLVKGEQASQ